MVAETFEQARAAAALVRVDYTETEGAFDLAAVKDTGKPEKLASAPSDTSIGDFEGLSRRRPSSSMLPTRHPTMLMR